MVALMGTWRERASDDIVVGCLTGVCSRKFEQGSFARNSRIRQNNIQRGVLYRETKYPALEALEIATSTGISVRDIACRTTWSSRRRWLRVASIGDFNQAVMVGDRPYILRSCNPYTQVCLEVGPIQNAMQDASEACW